MIQIIDVTAWQFLSEEQKGLREKQWLRSPDGAQWLRKRARESRPFEPAIEVFALQLARVVGLESAEARLATWAAGAQQARGVVVLSFLDGGSLIAGHQALRAVDSSYDPTRRVDHTVTRVVEALSTLEHRYNADLLQPFASLLLFDAWIGNGDRHPANWSLLRQRSGAIRFSPMYDPAGCLGAELQPHHHLLKTPTRDEALKYVRGCPSGFGDGKNLIRMPAVVASARLMPQWRAKVDATLQVFSNAMSRVPILLNDIDDEWLSPARKRFINAMLPQRLAWLREMK